jgi:hypothetical protein
MDLVPHLSMNKIFLKELGVLVTKLKSLNSGFIFIQGLLVLAQIGVSSSEIPFKSKEVRRRTPIK